jgi:hypothetical protein
VDLVARGLTVTCGGSNETSLKSIELGECTIAISFVLSVYKMLSKSYGYQQSLSAKNWNAGFQVRELT